MTLLDRYLFKQFAYHFILLVAALISIYLLIDVFERLDNFQERQVEASLIFSYFLAKTPVIYDQLAPVCLLLAGIITLGMMMNRLELQTINAGGISKARVMRPLLLAALLFTLLSLALAQWLLPQASSKVERIWQERIHGRLKSGTVRDGITFYRGNAGIYAFQDSSSSQLHHFSYIQLSGQGQRLETIHASQAFDQGHSWQLHDGIQVQETHLDNRQVKPFQKLSLALPDRIEDFFAPIKLASELPLATLFRQAMASQQDQINLHQRLSFILLGGPLLLIALPLMLGFQQSRGSMNLALAVPASAGLAFLAWGTWSGLQAMAQSGTLSPWLASWTIHLCCAVVGGVMLWKNTRY